MARSLYGLREELHGVTSLHQDTDASGEVQDVYDMSDEMLKRRTEELTDVRLFAEGAKIGRQVTEAARLLSYLAYEQKSRANEDVERQAAEMGMSVQDFTELNLRAVDTVAEVESKALEAQEEVSVVAPTAA